MSKGKLGKAGSDGPRQEVRSVVVGTRLLEELASAHGPLALSELSRRAGMVAAKAHRYLAGYVSAGLVEQDEVTGRYDLGPFALRMGLAALRRLDVTSLCQPVMEALRDQVRETVSLAIWTSRGPTLLRWVGNGAAVTININPGTVLPVTRSSNGRIFAAYLRPKLTEVLIEAELAEAADPVQARLEFESSLEATRRDGMSIGAGAVLPGICSISAPVFRHDGDLAAALTIVGVSGVLDTRMHGPAGTALIQAAKEFSSRMGWQG